MLEASNRISSLKPSPTIALNNEAKAMIAKGIKVTNMAVGEPDFATPRPIIDKAIASLQAGKTKYGAPGGGLPLRQAIVEKLKRDNQLTYDPEQIVAGIGAKEILFHIFMALINEGDEVIIPAPYWVSYTSQVEAMGGKAVVIPPADLLAGKRIDVAAVRAAITPRTKALVLNSPNNPAGFVYSEHELRELAALLIDTPLWVITDEIYEYMSFVRPHQSLLNIEPRLADRLILVNGMSKGFAMTGWRVGYMAGPATIAKLVRNLQSQSSTCIPPFIEDAASFALQQGASLLQEDLRILKSRRELALRQLRSIPQLDFVEPEGAFYIFLDVRRLLQQAKTLSEPTSMQLCQLLLQKYHLAVVPGEDFGMPGFLRMSYAAHESVIETAVQALATATKDLCS